MSDEQDPKQIPAETVDKLVKALQDLTEALTGETPDPDEQEDDE